MEGSSLHSLIQEENLVDMQTNNVIYTWNKKQKGDKQIAYRLDRFIISEDFLLHGPNIDASILPRATSNH